MKTTLTVCLLAGLPLLAQDPAPRLNCSDRDGNNDRANSCQVKEWTIAAPGRLTVDAGTNGGASIRGWSRGDTLIRAKIQTWAPTDGEAQAMQSQVQVETAGGNVRATGPRSEDRRGFAVSYEIFVPRRMDLSLNAQNGGITIDDVTGRIEFTTVNGGVTLKNLAGNVKGRTTNGGVKVDLAGTRWDGDELDVTTTNGGVALSVPSNYSARLEVGTVNGGFKSSVPLTVHGEVGKDVSATLGSGGALIRVHTTNGGVQIRQAS